MEEQGPERFQAVTGASIARQPECRLISSADREAIRIVSEVLPFRTNRYVLREVIQ